jgi:hypothetical protein
VIRTARAAELLERFRWDEKTRRSGWRESNPHSQLGRLELYH